MADIVQMTLGQWLDKASHDFDKANLYFGHGTNNSWDEAVWLAIHVLELPLDVDASEANRILEAKALQRMEALKAERIKTRKPLAYLIHEAWFCGLPFYVDERVLIPRSPIAELIQARFEPWLSNPKSLLDMCTGSGCIAIALAVAFPEAEVDACDISDEALEVAKLNQKQHHCEKQLTLHQSDMFSALGDKQYDLIVSNPPYVPESSMQQLPEEYRKEPSLALHADDEGLFFAHILLKEAKKRLTENGLLVVEVGEAEEAMKRAYPNLPLTWLQFDAGGEGVFLITAQSIRQHL